jgi:hypothetical protein
MLQPPHAADIGSATRQVNYLRRIQVARKFNVSVRTVERWAIAGGGPPFVSVGGIRLYPEHLADEWALARVVTSTSAVPFAANKAA